MKLKKFADLINECVKRAGGTAEHVDIEIYWDRFNDDEPWYFEIKNMGQFGVVPDVTIEIETDQWIEVKDRLPIDGQKVIYFFEKTGVDVGFYTKVEYPKELTGSEKPVYGNQFGGHNGFLTDDVTHWMPLPIQPEKRVTRPPIK